LQEYVVLDRRIIETNQFADELDASPRTISMPIATGSSPKSERRLSRSPSSAVNIPISPSTPPFVRERKTSTGSSAGSALAKALSKASVRLFGTSMPSPPKDSATSHHLVVGSPHGFFMTSLSSSSSSTSNRTMKHIERLACMAHAVSKYGDQKYDLLTVQKDALIADEAVVLYLKSLAILELGLNVAQHYWQQCSDVEEGDKNVMTSLNDAVQWMRDKFNECLKRAESIKDKHSVENSCVEKLLYDRALEMVSSSCVGFRLGKEKRRLT
jgi:serine/threonine-protein kinase ULK/ATG1